MFSYLVFSIRNPQYKEEIKNFIQKAYRILPRSLHFSPVVAEISPSILLCYWCQEYYKESAQHKINPGLLKNQDGSYIFCSGYAAEHVINGEKPKIFSLINDSESFSLKDSPGGVASYCWISPNAQDIRLWSTQPPAIPTFYAKNREGFCVAGNRPRLVYYASQLALSHQMKEEYFTKYLSSGMALDSSTPYENTYAIPPNKSILLREATISLEQYPLTPPSDTIPQDMPLMEKGEMLAKLLVEAVWPAKYTDSHYLALSGGKDSRTLACALTHANPENLNLFTFGSKESGETITAGLVADKFNMPCACRRMPVISDPLKAAGASNFISEGLGIAFPHQFNFVYDFSFASGSPVYHGHGHLLRGGFARTMTNDWQTLYKSCYNSFFSPFTTALCNQQNLFSFTEWLDERKHSFHDKRDLLLYGQQDFRVGLFTAPMSLDLATQTLMVFPLLDERIARFASQLSSFDKITERVLFGALKLLNQKLIDMPLYGEIWRFDREPDKTSFVDSDHNFQEGFENRKPQFFAKELNISRSNGLMFDADKSEKGPIQKTIAQFILNSSFGAKIPLYINSHVYEEIRRQAGVSSQTEPSEYVTQLSPSLAFTLDSFIKRVFIATTLYDLSW